MNNHLKHLTLLLALIIASSTSLLAGVPKTINYQGRLTDGTGVPTPDATHSIRFKIYGSETGGVELWDSNILSINTVGGLFSHQLGSIATLPESLFTDTSLWLGITVSPNAEMTPRVRLNTAPYSFHASFADSAGSVMIPLGSITAVDVDPSQIQLRVNGTAPVGSAITSISSDGSVGTSPFGSITGVTAGTALTGGGTSGNVTLGVAPNSIGSVEVGDNSLGSIDLGTNSVGADEIAPGAVGTSEIANNSIIDADISSSANISTSKISGTAVNLNSPQTITGAKTFSSRASFSSDLQIGTPVPGVVLSALGLSRFGTNQGLTSFAVPAVAGTYINWIEDAWMVSNRGTGNGGFKWGTTGPSGGTIDNTIPANPSGGWIMYLDNGGGLWDINGFTQWSDMRFKEDIHELQGALESVLLLRGVRYKWRDGHFQGNDRDHAQHIGLIAQEVQKVFPEIVSESENGYLGIDYGELTPILVEAIKQQQKLIEGLQKQVTDMQDMRAELTEVKAMVQRLSNSVSDETKTYSTK